MRVSCLILIMMFISTNKCINDNINSIESFTYETYTRGSSTMYTVTPDSLNVKSTGLNSDEISNSITTEEWNSLLSTIQNLKVSEMNKLKAPTDSRASDAALHAILSVRKNDTIYKTNSFDHGNPPAEVKPLVEAILRLAENVE